MRSQTSTTPKTSSTDSPLLEVHLAVESGKKADERADSNNGADYCQCNGARFQSAPPFLRSPSTRCDVSRRYAPHMQTGVSRSHRISQKKLKGRPNNIGSTRSKRATEKQVAAKGMNPSRIDPSEGRFMRILPQTNSRDCSRVWSAWVTGKPSSRQHNRRPSFEARFGSSVNGSRVLIAQGLTIRLGVETSVGGS
jgi:hypothetical protein